MTQEPQADIGARVDGPAVVEFGADEPPRRRPRASQVLTAARRDWRLVPIIAGLSSVAIFASLVGEWQTSTFAIQRPMLIPPDQLPPPYPVGVADLGGFSGGYLIGVFALVGCMGLVLFGRPAMRDMFRVLGLTAAGVCGAVLVSATVWLDSHATTYETDRFFFGAQRPTYDLAYGRGLAMAFVGVAGFVVAFYLAGRLMPAPPSREAEADTGAGPRPHAVAHLDWPWRRPRAARKPDDLDADLPPPADLTVGPTAPFAPMHDGRPPASGGAQS